MSDEPAIDTSIAHPARVYDYLLGGKDNYAADRAVGDRTVNLLPELVAGVRANRKFVLNAVDHLVRERGIAQLVDLGAGIPTSPAVHEIAQQINPDAVVAYVDNDPIVLAHDRALLGARPGVVATGGDLTDPPSVIDDPHLTALIDWDQPVGLIAAAVIHFIPDDQYVRDLLDGYRRRLTPGSAVLLAHATSNDRTGEEIRDIETTYATNMPFRLRSTTQIATFLDGFDIIEPGIVDLVDWRPSIPEARTGAGMAICAVGMLR